MEFAGAEDRDYYVHKDPAHDEFKKSLGPVLDKVQVVDFHDGRFG
jgi:hypothetical protein